MTTMTEKGVNLREFIDMLEEIAADTGDNIEVVTFVGDTDEMCSPTLGVGPCKDGIRRLSIA